MKTMSKMKNTLDGNNDKLDIVEEKTLKVEKENIQQGEYLKMNSELWNNHSKPNICVI